MRSDETDVIAAARHLGPPGAVIVRRTQPQRNPGVADDGAHVADHHHGTEDAIQALEARREVSDFKGRAVGVVKGGDQDRRIVQVMLLAAREVLYDDVEETVLGLVGVAL